MIQLALDLEPAADTPPTMRDEGWTVSRGVYVHDSGATVERRAYLDDARGELVFEARVNGCAWHEVREKFWETIERAFKGRAA